MKNGDINDYIPSLLNPRSVKKYNDFNKTQNTVVSRCSLSLKRKYSEFIPSKKIDKINTFSNNANNYSKKDNYLITTSSKVTDNLAAGSGDFNASANANANDEILNKDFKNGILSDTSDIFKFNNKLGIFHPILKPIISISFCIVNSKNVNVSTKNTNIESFSISYENNNANIICRVVEAFSSSSENYIENMDENSQQISSKTETVSVNLEIKRKKYLPTDSSREETNVLILKTNAIEKLSHVIVQPPNYKLVKRKTLFRDKFKPCARRNCTSGLNNGKELVCSDNLIQKVIDDFFCEKPLVHAEKTGEKIVESIHDIGSQNAKLLMPDDVEDMNKNSGVNDIVVKCDKIRESFKVLRENDMLSKKKFYSPKRDNASIRQQELKASNSEVPRSPSSKIRNCSISSYSPRKNVDSLHFSLPSKSKSNKNCVSPRRVPFYKIIAADLCTSRLGVNSKYIKVINIDETIQIDGVEVTAVDANHCPGAVMLVFTLPNGKTLLHTGDFRASPIMESYPVFWNKEMHTIYLDTTYCNPRYDFPTQDQSLEMALQLLREKKTRLEEVGKKFSSVLIVCGTYTIGKEKFFLGIARRVGCSVWACPEKDRVLQVVEGRSFGRALPHACQLHIVPMRDLTHDKLRAYLDSLQGAFSEVVAFKPSGWENGNNTGVQKDRVTIHGIPYSEHSSFSEMIRFVKFLKPKQVVPTVDIAGGLKTVQQFFPCPLVYNEDLNCQNRMTDYFSVLNRQQVHAVT